MKSKITRMDKKPAIAVVKLLNATQIKVVTTGTYKVGDHLEVQFKARMRLEDCQGMDDGNEKTWVAKLLELYQEGGSKWQEETSTPEPSTPTTTKGMKDMIREKIRSKRALQALKKTPSATE
jgi:hypothetical protein